MDANARPIVPSDVREETTSRLLAVAGVAVALMVAAALQLEFLNGPQGGKWPWRSLPFFPTVAYLAPALVLFGAAFLGIERMPATGRPVVPLILLTATTALLQILSVLASPHSFDLIRRIVESPSATSYYTDALGIQDPGAWLRSFHTLELGLHSSTHPPGPILYYHFWHALLGPQVAATVGGCLVGFLASLGVPTAYAFSGLWTEDRKARLSAAALYGSTPALILFFPEFDQVYPIFTMALALSWIRAAEGSRRAAAAFGLVLFGGTFFAYNLLTVGAFVALDLVSRIWKEPRNRRVWTRLSAASAIGLSTCAGAYLLVWLALGFRPLDSFFHALATEGRYSHGYERPYFFFLACNVFDFLLGAGMVPLPLLLSRLQRMFSAPFPWPPEARMTMLALGTVIAVDLSGTLAGETARVWLFLQPFLAVPAGLELARFQVSARAAVHALHWLVLVVMTCKLDFIIP